MNKTKVAVNASISLEKRKNAGYMNGYLRNECLTDPNFTRYKLYQPKQYQYLQHPILWVLLNISTIIK